MDEYKRSTNEYSDLVDELHRKMGIISRPEFDTLYRLTEDARNKAATAQRHLEDHVIDHEC